MERRELYQNIISDVAMEISVSHYWRKLIFALGENEKLCISKKDADELPSYIKQDIVENDLKFYVKISDSSNESFDEGLVVFEFSSDEYPDIVSYSGNNPRVI